MSGMSSEFAKALFMLASEKDSLHEYRKALELCESAFKENPRYAELLSTFAIPLEERLALIEATFGEAVPRDIVSFLKLMCEKKNIDELDVCAEHYYALYDKACKISVARVTSAAPLTEDEKKSLKERLESADGHVYTLEYIVDESILGGMIIETDGKIIDSSLKRHLKDIKDVIKR